MERGLVSIKRCNKKLTSLSQALDQCCPVEFSVMMEVFSVFVIQHGSQRMKMTKLFAVIGSGLVSVHEAKFELSKSRFSTIANCRILLQSIPIYFLWPILFLFPSFTEV